MYWPYMKRVFSVLAFDEDRSTYGMSEEVSSIYGDLMVSTGCTNNFGAGPV